MQFSETIKVSILFCLSAICFTGCSKNEPNLHEVYDANIKKARLCYNIYSSNHGYVGPESESVLMDYLKQDPMAIHLLKRLDLTPENVDEVFVSERDGEPFVIRYGLKGTDDHAVVFEKTGVEGRRLVALSNPIEVSASKYDEYMSGKRKGESSAGQSGGETE